MLELLMSEWEELLEDEEYAPVHTALQAGIALLEKYYRRADDTDVYFIGHGTQHYYFYRLSTDLLISFGSCFQTRVPQCRLGITISGCWDEAV